MEKGVQANEWWRNMRREGEGPPRRVGPFKMSIRKKKEKKKKKKTNKREEEEKKNQEGIMKLGTGAREKGKARAAEVEALTPIVGGEKQEIRKCFMLISMEISVISQKLLLPALICPHCRGPPPVLSGWSALSCRRSRWGPRLPSPRRPPRCGQPSPDY